MKMKILRADSALRVRCIGLITCAALILTGMPLTRAGRVQAQSGVKPQSDAQKQNAAETQEDDEPEVKIPAEQLDALGAPIALYPDPLLAQTLAASTYPLELVQLHQWIPNNRYLKGQGLAAALEMQPWAPSAPASAAFPQIGNLLRNNFGWTTNAE